MAKLKGHAVIELTDAQTGKKERVEHDNIITKGAEDLLNAYAARFGYSVANSALMTMKQKLFCGIYVFSNTLTENVNNKILPDIAETVLTGYASNITSDGNDNRRGDYNAEESGDVSNGFKFVWDFGTNDANGDIAAIGLTNYIAGEHGYKYAPLAAFSKTQSATGSTKSNYRGTGAEMSGIAIKSGNLGEFYYLADFTGDIITFIQKTSTTNIRIRKYKICLYDSELDLSNTLYNMALVSEDNITIADSTQTETGVLFVDGGDGFYYGLYGYNSGNNYILKVSKLNKSTNVYTAAQSYTLTNINMPSIRVRTGYSEVYLAAAEINNGYIYAYYGANQGDSSTGTCGIVKITLNNPEEYVKLTETERSYSWAAFTQFYYMFKQNGNIFTIGDVIGSDGSTIIALGDFTPNFASGYGGYGITKSNGKYLLLTLFSNNTSNIGGSNQTLALLPNLQQIESINNLDSPVTKTAAKTMKITYTLTYAE